MKRFWALFLLLLLAGCDVEREAWKTAASDRACTEAEMERVQHESAWCSKNTGYFSAYCYGTAILRNCPAMIEIKERLDK